MKKKLFIDIYEVNANNFERMFLEIFDVNFSYDYKQIEEKINNLSRLNMIRLESVHTLEKVLESMKIGVDLKILIDILVQTLQSVFIGININALLDVLRNITTINIDIFNQKINDRHFYFKFMQLCGNEYKFALWNMYSKKVEKNKSGNLILLFQCDRHELEFNFFCLTYFCIKKYFINTN